MMRHSKQQRWVKLAFLVAALAMLAVGFFLLQDRTKAPTRHLPELSQDEITRRAVEIAAAQYRGTPGTVEAHKLTMADAEIISCNPLSSSVAAIVNAMEGKMDWCNGETTVWVVELRGEFHQRATVTDSLSVALDGSGQFIRLGSGELRTAQSD